MGRREAKASATKAAVEGGVIMDRNEESSVGASRPTAPVIQGCLTASERDGTASILHEIFRKEALDESRNSLGAPIKKGGVTTSVLTAFFVIVLVAVVVFLVTARYARKETVSGQVTPTQGSFRIAAQITGIADRVFVKEGQTVKTGDVLFSVSADPVLGSGATLMDSLKAIQDSQRHAQALQSRARTEQITRQIEELSAKRDGLVHDIKRLNDSASLLAKRRTLLGQTADAHRKLADKGMVSPAFIRQQDDGLLAVRQQIQQSQREAGLQRSQLAQVEAQIGRLRAEADLAESDSIALKNQLQERELSFEAAHRARLVSPIDGVVTAIQIRTGGTLVAGQTLAVVIPTAAASNNRALEVELWAPSKAVGFVRPGAKVRLMYDAFPYQTFGVGHGTVTEVSGTPISVSDVATTSDSREQQFRIRVALSEAALEANGRTWPLVPGMRLTADLILEEQSLMEWILGPLRAVNKRAI